jgi:uncharacterized protein (DUF885 family)
MRPMPAARRRVDRTGDIAVTDSVSKNFTPLATDTRPEPRTPFDFVLRDLLDDLFEAQPTWATHIGFHAYDDRWPEVTDAGRADRLALVARHRGAIAALDDAALSVDESIDRGIILEALDSLEFEDAQLRSDAWDPLSYVALAGAGLFGLLAREFAPWEQRGAAFVGRLRGLPRLLDGAAAALTGNGDRPVSLLHTQTAIAQLSGVTDLIDQGESEADRRAASGDCVQIAAELHAAAQPARAAVEEFGRRLREDIAPRADGEGRLGRELFAQKLRHTLASDITPDELAERARRDYDLVRAEMLRLAREAWVEWCPGQQPPESEDETVRGVLDAIAREHRQPDELLEASRAEIARIEEFCRANNVIGLPDEPLHVTWTPVFMRAFGRAFLQSPGVLDKELPSYFWITPPDESGGPSAVESYLREENDRMLMLLAIHEAVPGHYLQGAYANRSSSLARAVFGSGMFAEGWAVYVTQVLMDLGYGDHEPALMLNHWKLFLRAITNAIMDVGVHVEDMTEEQAMQLMVGGGFQEQDEARGKWLRARLTATQLSTYYLGSIEMWDLELEARRRAAEASGAGRDSVPEQRIAGGFGATPDFDYRAHLESVIAHGTPPIKWVRRALFGEGS